MTKTFVIKTETGPARKNLKQETSDGVMIIPMNGKKDPVPVGEGVNVKVFTALDMKSTRLQILASWQSYHPQTIVSIFRKAYPNTGTLSVMLSRFRKRLGGVDNPPPEEGYLDQIKLSKKEYGSIRSQASQQRTKNSMAVHVVSNCDAIVLQALQYLTSNDPNLAYCALLCTTGLRPIEILKVAKFSTKLNNNQGDKQAWFACQNRFAKRGNVKSNYNPCRDRCFLAPFWMIERALSVVRKRWPVSHMDNVQINRRYSSHLGIVLQKAYPQWPGINAKMCRRFFAVYAYEYFGKSFFNEGSSQSSLIGFSHWMLGHASLGDEAIAYQSLVLRPKPKLKLFEIGRTLKVKESN